MSSPYQDWACWPLCSGAGCECGGEGSAPPPPLLAGRTRVRVLALDPAEALRRCHGLVLVTRGRDEGDRADTVVIVDPDKVPYFKVLNAAARAGRLVILTGEGAETWAARLAGMA